jgi:uncharacterized protein
MPRPLLCALAAGFPLLPALPAQTAGIAGSWEGVLKTPTGASIRLRIHLEAGADGAWKGALDSVDQGAFGIPMDEVTYSEGALRWSIGRLRASYEGRLSADGATLAGQFTQGVAMELNFARADSAAARAPARPQLPKPPFPYQSLDLTFPSTAEGVTLAGTLTLPPGAGPHPAIILITGSGPQDRDETIAGHKPFLVIADHLSRRGIAVLRYDDRGIARSTGDFASATSVDFSHDAEGAFDFLRTRKEIDPKRIGFLGHSEGGLVAPMVAARREEVAFLVLLAPTAVPGADVMLAQGEAIGRASGAPDAALAQNRQLQETLFALVRETPDPEKLKAGAEEALAILPEAQRAAQVRQITSSWMRFFITYDPAPVLRRVPCPVLAIFGERDLQVLPAQNAPVLEAALKEGGNERADIHTLPGLNHLLQPAGTGSPQEYAAIEQTIDPQALDLIATWLRRTAGLESAP